MRSLAAAAAAALTFSGPALAANMNVYKAIPYAFSWAGPYAGLNVGYGWGNAASDYTLDVLGVVTIPLASTGTRPRGLIAGAQLGYNFQSGAFVYGIEADAQYSAQRGSDSLFCPGLVCGVLAIAGIDIAHNDRINWFATLRGRLGYSFGQSMVYGTGGLAVAGVRSDLTVTTAAGSIAFANSSTRLGWTVGAGFEQAFTRNWSWKVEYLYMDFGRYTTTNALGLPVVLLNTTINRTTRLTGNVVRVGINYRF